MAQQARVFGKHQLIERPAHREKIMAQRRAASDRKGRDRLRAVAPDFAVLLEHWALVGPSMALQVTRAIKLLDLSGNEIFAAAIREVVARGLKDTFTLALCCDRLRRQTSRPVPVDVPLLPHSEDRDVVPHDLESYDDRE